MTVRTLTTWLLLFFVLISSYLLPDAKAQGWIDLKGPAQTTYDAPGTYQFQINSGVVGTGPKAEFLTDMRLLRNNVTVTTLPVGTHAENGISAGTYDYVLKATAVKYINGDEYTRFLTSQVIRITVNAPPVPFDGAEFVSSNYPRNMDRGLAYSGSVTFRNAGNTTWRAGDGYRLGQAQGYSSGHFGVGEIAVPYDVPPGGVAEFAFTAIAPMPIGEYLLQWQMNRNGTRFGTTSGVGAVIVGGKFNSAMSYEQSVPTTMVAGRSYAVKFRFRNGGNTTWSAATGYSLGSWNPANNSTWGVARVPVKDQVPGGVGTLFEFNVVAPSLPGTYSLQWRMLEEGIEWFGDPTPDVQVVVTGPPSEVIGHIDEVSGGGLIRGWACSTRIDASIDVHVYLGGAAGTGTFGLSGAANEASEPGVNAQCAAGGNHRFSLQMSKPLRQQNAGKAIYIHGISPVGQPNKTIAGSGNFRIPANLPPSITFTAPATGSVFGEGTSTLLSADASDPDYGVASVTYLADGNVLGSSGEPYQRNYGPITEGVHAVQVYATDTNGATTYAPAKTIYGSRVVGDIGLSNGAIFGWACSTYVSSSIAVHLYLGGAAGTGASYGSFNANLASEAGVNTQCKTQGTAYRFSIPVTDAMVRDHGGKKIYLHGISPVGGGNNLLSNSGAFSVPVNAGPSVSLTSPGNVELESPGQVRLVASASDPDDSVAQVAFYRDSQQVATLTSAPYEFTITGLAPGIYQFYAVATDRRGAAATSGTATVTVVQAQSPSGVTRSYVYDQFQRLCKTIEPETGATVVEYDIAGNVAWTASGLDLYDAGTCSRAEAAASGRRVDRSYDARNRVVSVRFPDRNGDQDLLYRNSGQLREVTTWNADGSETTVNTFQYNKRNLLIGEGANSSGRPTWSVGYGYDTMGALATVIYPSGLTVTYSNSAQGRPLSVSAAGTSLASGVRYHPNGSVQSFTYGNGITHSTVLNARQLPSEQVDTGIMAYRYGYDANANVASIADLQQGAPYDRVMQYDSSNRLLAAGSASFGGDHWHRYTYDARDNLLSSSLGGVKDHRYWYDSRNRLTNILTQDGATVMGLSYDSQGNLLNKNGRVHQFDMGNRLRAIQGVENYRYDATGRRTVVSDADGDRLRSLYGQAGQLLFEQRRGRGESEHIRLGSRLLAIRENGQIRYQHVDSLGSPAAASDATGQTIERTRYEPYGQSIGKTLDGTGYTGHVTDGSSGLIYMQQRYYDPALGLFLSVDPVTAYAQPLVQFNRYRYANGNPYRFADPDGRRSTVRDGQIFIQPEDPNMPRVSIPNNVGAAGVGPNRAFFHDYLISTPSTSTSREAVGRAFANNPTPGVDDYASPQGTLNNVGHIPFQFDFGMNMVRSFSVASPDPSRFTDVTINYTVKGAHVLEEGFVMQFGQVLPSGQISNMTYGEGNAFIQGNWDKSLWEPALRKTWEQNHKEVNDSVWGKR